MSKSFLEKGVVHSFGQYFQEEHNYFFRPRKDEEAPDMTLLGNNIHQMSFDNFQLIALKPFSNSPKLLSVFFYVYLMPKITGCPITRDAHFLVKPIPGAKYLKDRIQGIRD